MQSDNDNTSPPPGLLNFPFPRNASHLPWLLQLLATTFVVLLLMEQVLGLAMDQIKLECSISRADPHDGAAE